MFSYFRRIVIALEGISAAVQGILVLMRLQSNFQCPNCEVAHPGEHRAFQSWGIGVCKYCHQTFSPRR